jgi:hypothetical protein
MIIDKTNLLNISWIKCFLHVEKLHFQVENMLFIKFFDNYCHHFFHDYSMKQKSTIRTQIF